MTAYIPIAHALRLGLACALGATAAGCMSNQRSTVVAVRPAPSLPVQRADLGPPPGEIPQAPQPEDAPIASAPLPDGIDAGEGTQVAGVDPTGSAPAAPSVGRTDLLGGWTIASAGDSCQLFMSLTTWTGGYRASTRGCNSPSLAGISAWDLSGSTVTLKGDDGGSPVASLSATSSQRFSGSTANGAAITVSR